jgi:hypothetical protein
LLRQTIETELEQLDFSGFWRGVEEKLTEQKFPWTVRLRLWGEQWRPRWNFSSPAWVVATACLLVALGLGLPPLYVALTTSVPPPYSPQHVPLEDSEPFALAANEAQIESLSATDPIMVWNEPTSNATVIWVGDEGEGGSP